MNVKHEAILREFENKLTLLRSEFITKLSESKSKPPSVAALAEAKKFMRTQFHSGDGVLLGPSGWTFAKTWTLGHTQTFDYVMQNLWSEMATVLDDHAKARVDAFRATAASVIRGKIDKINAGPTDSYELGMLLAYRSVLENLMESK